MTLNNRFDNGQAQATPWVMGGISPPVEAAEKLRRFINRDTDSLIFDPEFDLALFR
jgi:hypothetical protein